MKRTLLIRAPHKYVQGKDSLNSFYEETKELGKRYLFVCSNSGYKGCHDKIEASFADSDTYRHYEVFGGISSITEVNRMQELVKEHDIDIVVAVGGGSAIDTAKATAYYEGKKIVIIPTVTATDAPCTGLSVIYEEDGSFREYLFYPTNPDAIIVDTQVVANAPKKFLIAGLGDALATYFEARACYKTDAPSLENGGISIAGMALARACFETIMEFGKEATEACELNVVTPALEKAVEAAVYLSGVGADNGGLAAAHSIYNGFTALDEIKTNHGYTVAFGTIVQLVLEGAPREELDAVMEFCYEIGLPLTLEEIGITDPARVMIGCEKATIPGETIHNMLEKPTAEDLYAAVLVADKLGKDFYEMV